MECTSQWQAEGGGRQAANQCASLFTCKAGDEALGGKTKQLECAAGQGAGDLLRG